MNQNKIIVPSLKQKFVKGQTRSRIVKYQGNWVLMVQRIRKRKHQIGEDEFDLTNPVIILNLDTPGVIQEFINVLNELQEVKINDFEKKQYRKIKREMKKFLEV